MLTLIVCCSLDQLKLGSSKMSEGQKKAVIRGAEEAFGDPGSWDATKLKKVSSFVRSLPAKQINKLPVGAVSGFNFMCLSLLECELM